MIQDVPVDLPEVVVTAARLPPAAGDAAFSVIRLEGETLDRATRLDEALATAPAVSLFRRTSGLGANPTTQGIDLRIAGRLTLGARARFESRGFYDDLNSRVLDAATTLGARAHWRVAEGVVLYVAADNLLDAAVEVSETGDGVAGFGLPHPAGGGFPELVTCERAGEAQTNPHGLQAGPGQEIQCMKRRNDSEGRGPAARRRCPDVTGYRPSRADCRRRWRSMSWNSSRRRSRSSAEAGRCERPGSGRERAGRQC